MLDLAKLTDDFGCFVVLRDAELRIDTKVFGPRISTPYFMN